MEKMKTKPGWFPYGKEEAASVLSRIVAPVRRAVRKETDPSVTRIAKTTRSPFRVLVSTVISARTKDEVTSGASARLFAIADTPEKMAETRVDRIEKAIYPAGFYKVKARAIRDLSAMLLSDFGGKVPRTIGELVTLPGVGRKTANLVVSLGFGLPAICVDTHVHRISNRLGWVETRDPAGTERELMRVLPRRWWIVVNELMVRWGQSVCTPLSPRCSACPVAGACRRRGVTRTR